MNLILLENPFNLNAYLAPNGGYQAPFVELVVQAPLKFVTLTLDRRLCSTFEC